jgi:hypothetical protein
MISFKKFYSIWLEDSSYAGGTLGPAAATGNNGITNADWYASGDFRIPKGRGVYRRSGIVKRKRKYKK